MKRTIFIISTVILMSICTYLLVQNSIYLLTKPESIMDYKIDYFNNVTEQFKTFDEVKEIAEKCSNYEYKVICVFNSIPFNYDEERAKFSNDNMHNLVLTPEHQMKTGLSICRDISIFRKSVLNEMGIESYLILKPEHVYLIAIENNQKYELNNQFMRII